MLNHRQIEILRTLIQTQNITRTAELLFTSQPTISRELSRIEHLIGFSLFQRINGRIRPTESAYTVFSDIEKSYIGLEKINQTIQNLKNNRFGQLELCSQPFLSDQFIPNILEIFLIRYYDIQISIKTLESPFIEIELSQQKFHLGLIEAHEIPQGTEILFQLQTHQVCILPQNHHLADKKIISIEDFHDQKFISLSKSDHYQQKIDQEFQISNIQPILNIEVDRVHSICNMVKRGFGISIINPLTALEYSNELIIKPISFRLPFFVSLVKPVHRPASNLAQYFANTSLTALQEIEIKLIKNHIDAKVIQFLDSNKKAPNDRGLK